MAEAAEQGRLEDPDDAGDALTLAAEIAEIRARPRPPCGTRSRPWRRTVRGRPAGRVRAGAAGPRSVPSRRSRRRGGGGVDRAAPAAARAAGRSRLRQRRPGRRWPFGDRRDVAERGGRHPARRARDRRGTGPASTATDPVVDLGPPDAPGVAFFLLQQRHRVRRNLNLPHDRQDDLADRLETQLVRRAGERRDGESDLLFWPRAEFDRLLAEHAALAEVYGPDWDAHRGRLEKELVRLRGAGQAGLVCPARAWTG
ncbi:hypothetical protein NKG94_06200 [Micromonospora sp. M12]